MSTAFKFFNRLKGSGYPVVKKMGSEGWHMFERWFRTGRTEHDHLTYNPPIYWRTDVPFRQ
jgi:hypothetical protein